MNTQRIPSRPLLAAILALILVMSAGNLCAQTAAVVKTPSDSSAVNKWTVARAWLNHTAAFAISNTKSAAWVDTVIVPGYKSGDFITMFRTTKSVAKPGNSWNQPWVTHLTAGRDTLLINYMAADTATWHFRISRKRL